MNSKPEELSALAEAVNAELRSIVRFLLRKERHEDWPGLLASRPEYADLKHQVDRLVAEFDEIRRTKNSTAAELQAFHDRAAEVDLPKSRIESELSAAWQDEHIALLAKKMTAFATAFEPCRLPLAGTADGKVRQYGAWSAPSACEALLRMAQGLIASHEHEGRPFDNQGIEWDRLLDDVRCEIGGLARREAASRTRTGDPTGPGDSSSNDVPPDPRGTGALAPPHDDASHKTVGDDAFFFRDGDAWIVQFAGQREVVKNVGGMRHIQRLLSSYDIPVSAMDLDGLNSSDTVSQQTVIDEAMAHDLTRRLAEIAEELTETRGPLTSDEKLDLAKERERLLAEIRGATFQSHPRTMKSPQGDAVGRVRAAIRRAVTAISKRHPALAKHLKDSLIDRGGANPCYRPRTPVAWRMNS